MCCVVVGAAHRPTRIRKTQQGEEQLVLAFRESWSKSDNELEAQLSHAEGGRNREEEEEANAAGQSGSRYVCP